MHVVDLTESSHQDGLCGAVEVEAAQQEVLAQVHNPSQPRQKLGPQAAAALQAGAKRKLPDSFRTHPPAKAKQNKQKALQTQNKPQHAAPPVHRQPSTRITAQAQAVDQAAGHAMEKVSNDALHVKQVLKSSPQADGDVVDPSEESSNSTFVKLASQAKRRLPESLVGPNNAGLKARAAGAKAGPTALCLKAGPSEHDTKV